MKNYLTILLIGGTVLGLSTNVYAKEHKLNFKHLYITDYNYACNNIYTENETEITTNNEINVSTEITTSASTENTTYLQNNSYIEQVLSLVNQERKKAGVNPLSLNVEICNVAQIKAEDMNKNNYFSHTSPNYGTPFQMLNTYGINYNYAGENIAKGQKTPEAVVSAWMNSEGHKANILNKNYTQLGVGYSNGCWVQMFVG